MVFTPTFLYLKKHSTTGLLYFGKTIRNPEIYRGSGSYWSNHIKKHGNHIETLWYCLFNEKDSLIEMAKLLSASMDIVNAKDHLGNKVFANLMLENGLDGCAPGTKFTEERLGNMSKGRKGIPGKPHTEEYKQFMSKLKRGVPRSQETKNKMKMYRDANPRQKKVHPQKVNKMWSKEHREKLSIASKRIGISDKAIRASIEKRTIKYTITTPENEIFHNISLKDFSEKFNFNYNRVREGESKFSKYKGYTFKRIEKPAEAGHS